MHFDTQYHQAGSEECIFVNDKRLVPHAGYDSISFTDSMIKYGVIVVEHHSYQMTHFRWFLFKILASTFEIS